MLQSDKIFSKLRRRMNHRVKIATGDPEQNFGNTTSKKQFKKNGNY